MGKPCSGYKMKEMTGSGIFAPKAENDASESDGANLTPKPAIRMYQQAVAGISHISFGDEEGVSPKKPTTIPEVAKQRELSGTLESEAEKEARLKKQLSDSKFKELSGHDIFAPPPEILPRTTTAPRALALKGSIEIGEPASPNGHTSVKPGGGQSNIASSEEPASKTAKKIYEKKFSELSGNDIFKGDVPPSSAEKPLSNAKLREMSGSNIFADGKAEARDYLGGVRKPPGGESSIALLYIDYVFFGDTKGTFVELLIMNFELFCVVCVPTSICFQMLVQREIEKQILEPRKKGISAAVVENDFAAVMAVIRRREEYPPLPNIMAW
ncbi:hypothetical protein Prudu_004371 [Prunus dulcis]|uniref:DUF4057 domain-containing protein n=1 Tax=Prunus dulcis TaxID=3755 RepID=A0A4Y1QV70_PRUDU|nr:hypothetical protein Prudu_004371 [Prunus dulcis]